MWQGKSKRVREGPYKMITLLTFFLLLLPYKQDRKYIFGDVHQLISSYLSLSTLAILNLETHKMYTKKKKRKKLT